MKLDEVLVERMKQTAQQYQMEMGDMASVECLQTNVEFEGHILNIMFTNGLIDGKMITWHLSVSNADNTAPVQEISQNVAKIFFGNIL